MRIGTKTAPDQGENTVKTQFSRQYLAFRELLQNDELQMFQQTLRILVHRGLDGGKLIEIRAPEVSPKFSIYVFRQEQLLSLLGGHWLRKGEPSKEFLGEMNDLALGLEQGRGLK
jgi:hypothetical protein